MVDAICKSISRYIPYKVVSYALQFVLPGTPPIMKNGYCIYNDGDGILHISYGNSEMATIGENSYKMITEFWLDVDNVKYLDYLEEDALIVINLNKLSESAITKILAILSKANIKKCKLYINGNISERNIADIYNITVYSIVFLNVNVSRSINVCNLKCKHLAWRGELAGRNSLIEYLHTSSRIPRDVLIYHFPNILAVCDDQGQQFEF